MKYMLTLQDRLVPHNMAIGDYLDFGTHLLCYLDGDKEVHVKWVLKVGDNAYQVSYFEFTNIPADAITVSVNTRVSGNLSEFFLKKLETPAEKVLYGKS